MRPTEPVEVHELQPPLAASQADQLLGLLGHKGPPWVDDIARRIAGTVAGSEDHFYVATAGARPVGHVWYNVASGDPRLGLIGHVFTHPDFRRRGVARILCGRVMADFLERGGQVMQLFTSTEFSIRFYESFGFENLFAGQVYHDTDWYLRYPAHSHQLLDRLLAPTAVSMRRLTMSDLPQYCLLYNSEHHSLLKDRAQRIGLGLEAELAFIEATAATVAGQGITCVLENGETLVGSASLMRGSFPYQSHVGIFDVYVHRDFTTNIPSLAEACLAARSELHVDTIYALAVDEDKRNTLVNLGFASRGTFQDHYRIGAERFDCELYQYE